MWKYIWIDLVHICICLNRCCMPNGASTFLRGHTNCPQRLLVAAYVATAMLPTPFRAATIWNSLQAMQQAPTIETTAGAPVCMTELAHHSIQLHAWPVALLQPFCSFLVNESDAGDLQEAPRTGQVWQAPHPVLICESQQPQGTTLSFHLLPTSDDNNACPMGYASTAGDTQEVPRTCQVLHKLRVRYHISYY